MKRIAAHLTDREIKQLEKELVSREVEISRAMSSLSNKIKNSLVPLLTSNLEYLAALSF